MQINSINFLNYSASLCQKSSSNPIFNVKNIAFKGDDELCYEDFKRQLSEKYPNKSFDEVAKYVISNRRNLIGSGNFSKVFTIPNIDNYVIKASREQRRLLQKILIKYNLVPVVDIVPNHNFGQPIARDGDLISVLKKVEGEQYSFYKYAKLKGDERLMCIGKFASDIAMMADFPLESYVDFAKKIKYLNENVVGYVFDYFNSNNLLIDKAKKEINIVDLTNPLELITIKPYKSDERHMIFSLLQMGSHCNFYKSLDPYEKYDLRKNSCEVIRKCRQGAKIAGLKKTDNNPYIVNSCTRNNLEEIMNIRDWHDKIDEFSVLYKDVLNEQI